jgi:hypothetical protein
MQFAAVGVGDDRLETPPRAPYEDIGAGSDAGWQRLHCVTWGNVASLAVVE